MDGIMDNKELSTKINLLESQKELIALKRKRLDDLIVEFNTTIVKIGIEQGISPEDVSNWKFFPDGNFFERTRKNPEPEIPSTEEGR
jgi:hypothetical protein